LNRGKLIEQLIFWHENNEHEQIISSIEKIPRNEWDFELSGLYARALNNLDHYQEALDLLMAFEHEGREDGVWNFRVGYSLYYLNREAEAAEYFQKAIDFGDDGEDTQEMLKRSIAEDLEKKWFNFTGKFNKKLIENGGDWDALSEKEQELAALWKLEADMYNGGFIQFFCNWGYTCYMHAVRGLTRLKAEQPLGIIQEQYNRHRAISSAT
jgi:tetratricopeptide (TPR) repeat protein